jgi:hypothetical protein
MIALKPPNRFSKARAQEAYAAFEAIYNRIARLPHIVDYNQLTDQERDLFDRAAEAYDIYLAALESEPREQGEGITEKG